MGVVQGRCRRQQIGKEERRREKIAMMSVMGGVKRKE